MSRVDRTSKRLDLAVGERVFIRLWRWDAERNISDANRDFAIDSARAEQGEGDPPSYHAVSVWSATREEGDSVESTIEQAIAAAMANRKAKYYAVASEKELKAAGFEWHQSGPPGHFDIPIGVEYADEQQASDLAVTFGMDEKIRIPA
ncbi:hypothetical protein AAFP30_22380 [Gordonia sp. CPCC 205515]|uniref:hypothetical protein n=1 Tax=Gordonia sp. CPCC 205515 TaxID=3140791 RepID=UPI003AF35FED